MNHIVKILSVTMLSCMMASVWADISKGLVAYNPLDGDPSQLGQNYGYVQKTEDRLGNPNSAFYFDGQSYISIEGIGGFEESSSISIAFWVSPDLYDNYLNIFGIGEIDTKSKNSTFRAEIQENGFYGFFGSTKKKIHVTGQTMVPAEEWTFVALTYDDFTGQSKLYVNGNLYNVLENAKIDISSPMTLTLGLAFRKDSEHFFQGKVDEFYLYHRALSKIEVQELYKKCPKQGTCSLEPALHEMQIDYYRNDNNGEIYVDQPAWRSRWRIKGDLPDNISEYGLRSLYLARYACSDSDVRDWMPFNLINASYYCTNEDDRQEVIEYLQGLIYQLEEELGVNQNSETDKTSTENEELGVKQNSETDEESETDSEDSENEAAPLLSIFDDLFMKLGNK